MNRLTYFRSLEYLSRTTLHKEIRNRYPTIPRDEQNFHKDVKISNQVSLTMNYLTP